MLFATRISGTATAAGIGEMGIYNQLPRNR